MKKHFAAMHLGLMLAATGFGRHHSWDEEDFMIEKSELPVKEPMPLTEEETEKLGRLHGKYKKLYLKELKEKYESGN